MAKNNNIQELFQREVSRKEFVRLLGLAILGVVGVTGMLSNLDKSLNAKRSNKAAGYGNSSYGR